MTFLSVIIPTRNRADCLNRALESFTIQSYPADLFEVIVIDNGSTDSTKQVCASFQERFPHICYQYEPSPGLHSGRHAGMRMARSDILVYADDDIEAFPSWLEAIAESFQNPEVVLVGGKNLPKFEAPPPDWIIRMWENKRGTDKILAYLSLLDIGNEKREISPYHVFGCNFSIRKKILLQAGGFHPDAMPKELIRYRGDGESYVSKYLYQKQLKAFYHPGASVHHFVPADRMTKAYFCNRSYIQGISDSYTEIREKTNKYSPLKIKMGCLITMGFLFSKLIIKIVKNSDYQFLLAYISGYKYHVSEVINDRDLFKWVKKQDYI